MHRKFNPGDRIVLLGTPPGLPDGLPVSDHRAIAEVVGKAILFNGYDPAGRAELEFVGSDGDIHFICVSADLITTVDESTKEVEGTSGVTIPPVGD